VSKSEVSLDAGTEWDDGKSKKQKKSQLRRLLIGAAFGLGSRSQSAAALPADLLCYQVDAKIRSINPNQWRDKFC
jgi:hypothetical protein